VRRGTGSLRISWEVEETQKSLTELEAVASGRAPAKQGRMCSITVFSSALLERDSGPDPDYSVNASWQHLFKKTSRGECSIAALFSRLLRRQDKLVRISSATMGAQPMTALLMRRAWETYAATRNLLERTLEAGIGPYSHYPKTQIVMDNGAVICVFETPDDIAQWTKSANLPSK
jgi:hypothetical protein